ncbi:MAG: hypothetical protein QOJ64_615 [Acidobacteriota bacterium]|jgi:hypothetical protein|nr:hypothetical protein [Acidobacteriota bacterium]
MSRQIHLIERIGYVQKLEGRICESGFWGVPPQTAQSLLGGDIYFHKKQKESSFFGGKILGYRMHEEDDEYRGRVIFRFEYSREHRDVSAGSGGWSNEKKII